MLAMSHSLSSFGTAQTRSVSPSRTLTMDGGFTRLHPPFALDFEVDDFKSILYDEQVDSDGESVLTNNFEDSVGYREGGPKEARLRKVAMLAPPRDVNGFFPIKIGIDSAKSVNNLRKELEDKLSDIDSLRDIYIPENIDLGKPAQDFAVLRFSEEEEARKYMESLPKTRNIETRELEKQKSFFTKNSGAMGISNEAIGEISVVERVVIKQDIEFDDCMARNGAPWTSCRELKSLAPHKGASVLEYPAIKIKDLPRNLKVPEIQEVFERYGRVMDVKCPKPLQVNLRVADPNCGYAFVRYKDKRDLDDALADIKAGKVSFYGVTITGDYVAPIYWPTENTRRYY